MVQKALFPMLNLRVTQDEFGSVSHKGSRAQDHGGANSYSDDVIYAPYDGYVARVRTDSSHETYFVSSGAVDTPSGYNGVLTTTLMHDNVLNVRQGQTFKRGDKIGDEGGFGRGRKDAYAHHVHIEVSRGKQTTQARNAQGVYCTPNQISLQDAFFVASDTKIIGGAWHVWSSTSDTLTPRVGGGDTQLDTTKPMQLKITAKNCEYFAACNVANPLGKLALETVYDVAEYYLEDVFAGTQRGHWVRFAFSAGDTAYCLVLPDRASLVNAEEPAAQNPMYIQVAVDILNVRSAPGTIYMITGTVALGDKLYIAEQSNEWGFVLGKGWISLEHTNKIEEK